MVTTFEFDAFKYIINRQYIMMFYYVVYLC